MGQESVARTHHRGVIRKRLMPLKFVDNSGRGIGFCCDLLFQVSSLWLYYELGIVPLFVQK